ncbi:MAG: hypothetical protein CL674_07225 [Bdellovibrionaceae bacterium]|nr:hypothetical protein [Pseudobdellovibrionaceae bacterium]|tara:strand:- start:4451 stop:7708 length:3258 start_codon:yes stop_codon:yes gene_type:complete
MPKTSRSINFSFLFVILSLSIAPLFQNCSSQIDFGQTDNFALEQGYAELVDFYIDPNSWDAKPNINVVAIVDNSNSMSPIQEKVASGLEQSLDPLNQFAGRLELYTTTQGLDPVFTNRNEEDLKLSVVKEILPYKDSDDADEFIEAYRLPASFTKDSSGTRRSLYYNPDNLESVKQSFGQSIRELGTLGSSDEQGICTLMRSIASQSEEEQTQHAFVLVSNEDDATDISSCLDQIENYKVVSDGSGFQDCTQADLGRQDRPNCIAQNKLNVTTTDYKTKLFARYDTTQNHYAVQSDSIRRNNVAIKLNLKRYGYKQDTRSCDLQLKKSIAKKDLKLNWAKKKSKWKMQYQQNRVILTASRKGVYNYEGRNFEEYFEENLGTYEANSCSDVRSTCNSSDLAKYTGNYQINADGTMVPAELTNTCNVLCTETTAVWKDQTSYQNVYASCEQNFENNQLRAGNNIGNVPNCSSANCRFQCSNLSNESQSPILIADDKNGSCDQDHGINLADVSCTNSMNCQAFCAQDNVVCNSNLSCSADNDESLITSSGYSGDNCDSSISDSLKNSAFTSSQRSGCGSTYSCTYSVINSSGSASRFTALTNYVRGKCSAEDDAAAQSKLDSEVPNCQNCTAVCSNGTSSNYSVNGGYSLDNVCLPSTNGTKYSGFESYMSSLQSEDLRDIEIGNNDFAAKLGELSADELKYLNINCSTASYKKKLSGNNIVDLGDASNYSETACSDSHSSLVSNLNSWFNSNTGTSRSTSNTSNMKCYVYEEPTQIITKNNVVVKDEWDFDLSSSKMVYSNNCSAAIPSEYRDQLGFPNGAVNTYCELNRAEDNLSAQCSKNEAMLRAGATQEELRNVAEAICDANLNLEDADQISYSNFSSVVKGQYPVDVPGGSVINVKDKYPHLQALDAASIKNAIQVQLGTLEGSNFASFVTPPENSQAFAKCEEEAASYNPEDPNYNPFAEGALYSELMTALGNDKASTYSVCEENYVAAFQEIVDRVVAEAEFSYKISLAEYENVYKVFLVDQSGSETELMPYMYFVKAGLINIEPAYYYLLTEKVSSIRVQIYRDLQAKEELGRVPASAE